MIDTGEETLAELVSHAVDDAKEVARAEIGLVRAQVADKVAGYRVAAILLATAGLLGVAALFGLVVGVILTLAPRTGPGWATLIVIGGLMLIVGVLAKFGIDRIKAA